MIRYAKIDFGIDVEIDLSRLRFAETAEEADSVFGSDSAKSTKNSSPTVDYHFALGQIKYEEGRNGLLLYLKSSVSGNEGKPIESYRSREPDFPHQSIADLAYDEEQFEGYRSLGEHIVDDAFRTELVGDNKPENVAEWLSALRSHLHR